MLVEKTYDRDKAVAYARKWAYSRNPSYYDFSSLGGDCTNFASQCIFSGAGAMNYTETYGWYYINLSKRSPSWTGVPYLYNFLVSNRGAGPFGRESVLSELLPGDIIQLAVYSDRFEHCPVVTATDGSGSPDSILVAAHSIDCLDRPLSSYNYKKIRCVRIEGTRRPL